MSQKTPSDSLKRPGEEPEQADKSKNRKNVTVHQSPLVCYAFRLGPGEEIRSTLLKFVEDYKLSAAFVMTCVGSVTKATIRLANVDAARKNEIVQLNERFEIVSLVGTLSDGGHLHISLSDKNGKTVGGHVVGGLEVFTTAEIVIGQLSNMVFEREMDDRTGFKELVVKALDN